MPCRRRWGRTVKIPRPPPAAPGILHPPCCTHAPQHVRQEMPADELVQPSLLAALAGEWCRGVDGGMGLVVVSSCTRPGVWRLGGVGMPSAHHGTRGGTAPGCTGSLPRPHAPDRGHLNSSSGCSNRWAKAAHGVCIPACVPISFCGAPGSATEGGKPGTQRRCGAGRGRGKECEAGPALPDGDRGQVTLPEVSRPAAGPAQPPTAP